MPDRSDDGSPLAADRRFFDALRKADAKGLSRLLAEDFVLIDVLQGGEIPGRALVEALATGQLRFDSIGVLESRERRYGTAAIVTGRTEMSGRGGDQVWAARSRYVHVFVEKAGQWQLVSAQGTQIAGSS